MNKHRTTLLPVATVLLFALLALGGCMANEQEIPPAPQTPTEVEVDLSLNIRSADNPMSRADYDLDKTPDECKISSVSIFIVPVTKVAGAYVEDWDNAQYRMEFSPAIAGGYYSLTFKFTAPTGLKRIYAAANMSLPQTLAFMDTNGAYRSTATTYKTVINEFADVSATGPGIVMISPTPLQTSAGTEIDFSGSGIRTIATEKAELVRVVSKVLMVCKTDNTVAGAVEGQDYAIATDYLGLPLAWVRLENVYFALDPTGKVLYRQETSPPDDYVSISSPIAYPPLAAEWMGTLAYDADRIGEGNADKDSHYTTGLYCLANKASEKETALSTNLVVCAKYLPRILVVGYNTVSQERTCLTTPIEAVIEDALAPQAGQIDEKGDPVAYPAGTYWRLGGMFYSYAGMMETIDNAPISEGIKREDFLPYIAGRGYYRADIDVSTDLLRNYYYIITVLKFGVPQHTLDTPGGGEMQINSQKTEWLPQGAGTIIVKPE